MGKVLSILFWSWALLTASAGEALDLSPSPWVGGGVNAVTGQLRKPSPFITSEGSLNRLLCEDRDAPSTELEALLEPDDQGCLREWHYDSMGRLCKVSLVYDGDAPRVLETLTWSYAEDGSCTVCDVGGRKYHVSSFEEGVQEITAPDGGVSRYIYCRETGRLLEYQISSGPRIVVGYADGGNVSSIERLGCDGQLYVEWRLEYHPQSGYTDVFDAEGTCTRYRYKEEALLAKEYFGRADPEVDSAHYMERFFWDEDSSNLLAAALVDPSGLAVLCQTYEYDLNGRCVAETLWGDLSGNGLAAFQLDEFGRPIDSGVESYCKFFAYDGDKLVRTWEDNAIHCTYNYEKTSPRPQSILIADDTQVRLRHFYSYDAVGNVESASVDDGCGVECGDLSGVSHRRTLNCIYSEMVSQRPYIVDEAYLDFETGENVIKQSSVSGYDACGRVTSSHQVDADQVAYGFSCLSYDEMGRVISVAGESGYRQCRYDACGRVLVERDALSGMTQYVTYSDRGEVVSVDIQDGQGDSQHHAYRYDAVGRCIEHIDPCGNGTSYSYDSLGRLSKIEFPQVFDSYSSLGRPTLTRKYDIMGRPIEITGPLGDSVKLRYNARGAPVFIEYADGTNETYVYNLDGSLREWTSRQNITSVYDRDALSRVVEKTLLFPSGDSASTKAEYGSLFIETLVDPSGRSLSYERNSAGDLISVTSEWEGGQSLREYGYDGRGNLSHSSHCFGEGGAELTRFGIERDERGNALSINLMDHLDESGVEIRLDLCSKSHERGRNDCKCEIDWQYSNAHGQKVCRIENTDSDGSRASVEFDALGRVVDKQCIDSYGFEISRQRYTYDLGGNRLSEAHFSGRTVQTTEYRYGPQGRVEGVTEYVRTPLEATTTYDYDALGRLSCTMKPDGVRLYYSYNDHGCVEELYSSDGSVWYRYEYDLNGRVTNSCDLISDTTSHREHHPLGGCSKDSMSHDIEVTKVYDDAGRVSSLTLPDGSGICYEYTGSLLSAVVRVDSDGMECYRHSYSSYAENGALIGMELPCDLGDVTFAYDDQGRLQRMSSPYTSLRFPADGYDDRGRCCRVRNWDSKGCYDVKATYDTSGRLISEKGVRDASYIYDAAGNRLMDDNLEYCYDEADQLTRTGDQVFDYDACGNVVRWRAPIGDQYYTYDALDRLVDVIFSDGIRVSFTYDGFHRRLSKTIWNADTLAESWRYIYDDDKEIGAVDDAGNIVELRVLGCGIAKEVGAAVALELHGAIYVPLHDHRGTISTIVDARSGAVTECYRHDAFGNLHAYDALGNVMEGSQCLCPWRFGSKRADAETGLIYFGARYYAPELGRWMSRDPLGSVDGHNRYIFAQNNPLSRIDPNGCLSVYGIWSSVTGAIFRYVRTLGSLACSMVDLLDGDLELFGDIKDDFDFVSYQLIGPTIFMLAGLGSEPLDFGVYGKGEFNDKVRVTHINGILNNRDICMDAAGLISRTHGGVNVHYVFRPTDGFSGDLINGFFTILGFTSPNAKRLAEGWREMIDEVGGVGGGGVIVHYAHSLGGAETACARLLLSAEEQKMIRVTTFGSAKAIKDDGFCSVHNFISRRDFVMTVDILGYFSALMSQDSNVTFLESMLEGFPFIDHEFVGPTYSTVLNDIGQRFVALYDPSQFDVIYIHGEER